MTKSASGTFFPLFDGGIASCEVHLSKPDPKFFGLMMQKYGLAYDETIFVDDTKVNAQAAYNLGITGILYKGPKSFQRALGLWRGQDGGRQQAAGVTGSTNGKSRLTKP